VLLYKLLLYIVNRFVKDKENRDDEEVKINFILFIPSILVIFIFFMPYKNVDNTYRNNAQKIISSFGSALQVVADKMTYSLTESVLLNLKNRGGLVDYFEANENAKRYFRLKFQQIFFKDLYETVNSHYLNSENYAKMEYYNNKSYAYSSGDFIADIYGYAGSQVSDDYYFAKNFNFSYYGVCNTWGGAYPGLGNESNFNAKNYKINKELQALDRWFDTLEKNSTVNAEKSELLNKIITHAVDQSEKDGFLSLITTVPNVFILSNLILNNDEQIEKMKEKIEEALDAGTPAESMARVMTENIAYLTAPGAELIMNSIKGLGNAIPGAGLFTTPIAVATAIIYGQNFYELLYIFVYIFIISISLLLWWVGISLYIIISYFIPAFVFFKDNANIVSTFTKTVAVHLFKIPIVVISSVIGFSVMSLMITLINYQSFSLNTMQNSIQESSFNIGSSLIVGLMSVLAYLLISGLIYWLITKGTKVFTEAISKQFSDSDDAMQIVENRIKSKM
jgi:membrane-associated HD superfamily phosphohydrolase